MAGRYFDWTHVRTPGGDRAAASPYIGDARKLLGEVFEQAEVNGLGVHAISRQLDDGTVIVAEKHGDIPRVTIVPVGTEGAEKRTEGDDAFVTWARTEDTPDGIDDDHPQLIHRVEDSEWVTLFYDQDIEGFADFQRRKGTYQTQDQIPVFPAGVTHAGNVDWVGEAGVRVSWHGPSSRYFLDAYVQPRSQYGTKVFILGQVLLDADQYMADSDEEFAERWVLGAALSPALDTLYVVHADLPVGVTLTGNAPARTVMTFSPFPVPPEEDTGSGTCPIATAICSYSLGPTGSASAPGRAVVPGSRKVLAYQIIERAINPWFFNWRASEAVSVAFPESTAVIAQGRNRLWTPSTANNVCVFADGGIELRPVSAEPGGEAVLAVDFSEEGIRQLVVRRRPSPLPPQPPREDDLPTDGFVFAIAGVEWTGYSTDFTAWPSLRFQDTNHRALLWADLREGTVVFAHMRVEGEVPSSITITYEVEVWHGPSRVASEPIEFSAVPAVGLPRTIAASTYDTMRVMNLASDLAVSPFYYLYGQQVHTYGLGIVQVGFGGRIGTYWTTPYPQEHMYGQWCATGATPRPWNVIASVSSFASDLPGYEGKPSVLGAASFAGATLLSCFDFGARNGQAINLMHGPEDGVTLPIVTGVEGTKQRYHPIWLLGKIPEVRA